MQAILTGLSNAGKFIAKVAAAAIGAFRSLSPKEAASLMSFIASVGIGAVELFKRIKVELFKRIKKMIRNAKHRDNDHHVVSTMTGVDTEQKEAIRKKIIDEADKEAQINVSGEDKDYSTKRGKKSIERMKKRLDKREKWIKRNHKKVVPKDDRVEVDKSSKKNIFNGISMMDPNFPKVVFKLYTPAA